MLNLIGYVMFYDILFNSCCRVLLKYKILKTSLQCPMLLHTTKTKDPESQAIQLRSSKSIWIIYSNLNAKHTSNTLPSTHTPIQIAFPRPILNIENWILDIESLPYQGHGPHPSCLRAVRAKQQGLWLLGRQLNPCRQSRGEILLVDENISSQEET